MLDAETFHTTALPENGTLFEDWMLGFRKCCQTSEPPKRGRPKLSETQKEVVFHKQHELVSQYCHMKAMCDTTWEYKSERKKRKRGALLRNQQFKLMGNVVTLLFTFLQGIDDHDMRAAKMVEFIESVLTLSRIASCITRYNLISLPPSDDDELTDCFLQLVVVLRDEVLCDEKFSSEEDFRTKAVEAMGYWMRLGVTSGEGVVDVYTDDDGVQRYSNWEAVVYESPPYAYIS